MSTTGIVLLVLGIIGSAGAILFYIAHRGQVKAEYDKLHGRFDQIATQLGMLHQSVQASQTVVLTSLKQPTVATPAAPAAPSKVVYNPASGKTYMEFAAQYPVGTPIYNTSGQILDVRGNPVDSDGGNQATPDFGAGGNLPVNLAPGQGKERAFTYSFNVAKAGEYTVSADNGVPDGKMNWRIDQGAVVDVFHTDTGNASGSNPPTQLLSVGPAMLLAWINPASSVGMAQGAHSNFMLEFRG